MKTYKVEIGRNKAIIVKADNTIHAKHKAIEALGLNPKRWWTAIVTEL